MGWSYLLLMAGSAAAGVGLGRVIPRRVRQLLLIGGVEAALLGSALTWLPARGVELPWDPATGHVLGFGLLAIAAVLVPFWLGAAWSGP